MNKYRSTGGGIWVDMENVCSSLIVKIYPCEIHCRRLLYMTGYCK